MLFCILFNIPGELIVFDSYSKKYLHLRRVTTQMLFRSPQCLYASAARWPQQGLAAVHPWRCMRCICVRKILFVDDRMYLAFRNSDDYD